MHQARLQLGAAMVLSSVPSKGGALLDKKGMDFILTPSITLGDDDEESRVKLHVIASKMNM